MLKKIAITVLLTFCASLCLGADSYEQVKAEAEKLYSQKSYALAHQAYSEIQESSIPDSEKRWVTFRLADTLWRAEASSRTADHSNFQKALEDLNSLIQNVKRKKDRDVIWMETQESLGDFYMSQPRRENWAQAWDCYQKALDGWAGSRDIEIARQHYVRLVYKVTSRTHQFEPYFRGQLPLEILENFKKIAKSDSDRAYASYLLALALRGSGDERVSEEFQSAINLGSKTDWYDDALFEYAMFLLQGGNIVENEGGEKISEPDYVKAVEIFRRIIKEFSKGQTRYWDQAAEQIKQITQPQLEIRVTNIFLPESKIQYYLNGRNLKNIEFKLWQADLPKDVHLNDQQIYDWVKSVELKGAKLARAWTFDTQDKGEHKPFSKEDSTEKLPLGAYILEAKGENVQARDLVLVTDAALVLKTSDKQALVYFCESMTGKPIAQAAVKLWVSTQSSMPRPPMPVSPMIRKGGRVEPDFPPGIPGEPIKPTWKEYSATTNEDGIAVFQLTSNTEGNSIFAAAQKESQQAFNLSFTASAFGKISSWKIYAETDRAVYRPKEVVKWKITARVYDGKNYSTPIGEKISYKILDPRGNEIKKGEATLNAFGSFWDSVELSETMPLGEYQISFSSQANEYFGSNTLFRLEEYKLPEFKVSVQLPQKDGKKLAFRLGEKIQADIQADYYSGGAVNHAQLEVVVYQKPFLRFLHPKREYPWLYRDMEQFCPWGGPEQIIKHEKLTTDASGKAKIEFETPRSSSQDLEYRIEARVTDASRREIIGSDTIKVTRQRYLVQAEPENYLHQPSDKVQINFKAADANDQPKEIEGTVKITRDYWYETWISSEGKEIRGDELRKMREQSGLSNFFRKPVNGEWKLKSGGYEHEEISTQKVKTNAAGEAELIFTPGKEGYYRIAWNSPDAGGRDVRAETVIWAVTDQTTELGYRTGGVEIIADKDTFQLGQKAPVMISTHASDRYVLFSVQADDLLSYQLIHVEGTAKLVQLDIEEKHTPNIFLEANMVSENQLFVDTKQIVIPPKKNFLDISMQAEKEELRPGEANEFTVTALDSDKKPIAAEFSFGVIDEAISYIQKDYAEDPREFFFGEKKPNSIQTTSTFHQHPYVRLPFKEEEPPPQPMPIPIREMGGFGASNEMAAMPMMPRAMMKNALASAAAPAPMMMQGEAGVAGVAMDASFAKEEHAVSSSYPIQTRTDFRSTIIWQPDFKTDENGKAKIKLTYPDSMTSWRATARAVTTANQFGITEIKTHTQKPLIARLQAPRFFVVGDEVTLSGVLQNNTDKTLSVRPMIEISDVKDDKEVAKNENAHALVDVSAHGETRVDWRIRIDHPGQIRLRLAADAIEESDAMQADYPVYERGIDKLIAQSGKMKDAELSLSLDLPNERRSTKVSVQVTPSLAVTMLDALPYLINEPYGCVEQTMDRFLPAAIVTQTLGDLGLSAQDVTDKIFGGIEKEFFGQTHSQNTKNLNQLRDTTTMSLEKLYDAQREDGSWGWWKGSESDKFMTAYVVWGLTLARKAGVEIRNDVLERAREFLRNSLVQAEQDVDLQAWMLHALASGHSSEKKIHPLESKALENVWNNRENLNAYTRALLALSLNEYAEKDRAKIVIQNLVNGVKLDSAPNQTVLENESKTPQQGLVATAHWGEDGIYYRWSEGGVEATAFALRALMQIDPKNELVEPTLNWLIKNRRGAQWSNTRDTAIVIFALNEYLKASGELKSNLEYELSVNNQVVATQKISPQDVLKAPSQFEIDASLIKDTNTITIKKKGEGNLYFAAYAQFFSGEKPIKSAGNEIFVKREYFKKKAYPTLLKGFVYENQLLKDGDELRSGDRVEVVLTIETKNNYEYLMFEDLKPAGLEAVQLRSGENIFAKEFKSNAVPQNISEPEEPENNSMPMPLKCPPMPSTMKGMMMPSTIPLPPDQGNSDFTGRRQFAHQELRDQKVAFFFDKLPQGVWQIRYELRAEAPGKFSALPTLGRAMYVPEIRCNGEEVSLSIKD